MRPLPGMPAPGSRCSRAPGQEVVALAMDAAAKAAGKLADSGCEEAIQAFLSEAGDAR